MKNILTTALLPLLAGLAFSCTSTTALQTTESDDLYYASSDRTLRPEQTYGGLSGVSESEVNSGNDVNQSGGESTSPEYYDPEAASRPAVTNNYYYDDDRYYSRGRRSHMYYNDPFYSPFGYSAAYCYGIYDPFCFPGYYPYSGLTVSFNFGYGYPYGYGYRPYGGYGYGYRPYDYYGYGYGGYGGYYQGFYDGYYAGGGYGYGYNRNRVNYAPRRDRSNAPAGAPASTVGGRPADPGRVGQTNGGSVIPGGGRPQRVAQTGGGTPGPVVQPGNAQPQNGRSQSGRPMRSSRTEQNVQPENYQFQNTTPPNIDYSRPGKVNRGATEQPSRPVQDATPAQPAQNATPMQPEQSERSMRSRPTYQQPSQQNSAPVYQNSRPSRSGNSGGSYEAPSRGSSGGGSGSGMPSGGGMGRPRR